MPFDCLPESTLSDMVKLSLALDGVRNGWRRGEFGKLGGDHCAIGWLLEVAEGNVDETTRLALNYVYPALPEKARGRDRMQSIWEYNDQGSQKRVIKLFEDAVTLAQRVMPKEAIGQR